jgi:hypothetical protein
MICDLVPPELGLSAGLSGVHLREALEEEFTQHGAMTAGFVGAIAPD